MQKYIDVYLMEKVVYSLKMGRVGPKLSSVNILILNKGTPMKNIIPLPENP